MTPRQRQLAAHLLTELIVVPEDDQLDVLTYVCAAWVYRRSHR